jgi:hypothetical protein
VTTGSSSFLRTWSRRSLRVQQEGEERYIAEQVKSGASVDGLYPLTGQWRAKYEAQRDEREEEP